MARFVRVRGGVPKPKDKKSHPWAGTKSDMFDIDEGCRLSVELSQAFFSTVYGLLWFFRAFWLCGWIPVCVPPAAFQLKWAGGKNFPGFFFAFGALSVFGSHGNEVFSNVSVFTFKFIDRHVHPPEMANNPSIWYQILGLGFLFYDENLFILSFLSRKIKLWTLSQFESLP